MPATLTHFKSASFCQSWCDFKESSEGFPNWPTGHRAEGIRLPSPFDLQVKLSSIIIPKNLVIDT